MEESCLPTVSPPYSRCRLNTDLELSAGSRRKVKIMLLAGGDLIQSFGEPGVWAEPDVRSSLFDARSLLTLVDSW